MKINIEKLNLSLLLVFLYELFFIMFKLDGISFIKLFMTSLLWISIFNILGLVHFRFYELKNNIPQFPFRLFQLLIFCYTVNILRGFFDIKFTVFTMFGNIYNALALVSPIFVFVSIDTWNLTTIYSFLYRLLKLGLFLIPICLLLIAIRLGFNEAILKIIYLFVSPVVFLITTLPFQGKKSIIIFSVFCVLFFAFFLESRSMVLRVILLLMGLLTLIFSKKYNFKSIQFFVFILTFLPVLILLRSVSSGESFFKANSSYLSDTNYSTDTRTFLYVEVITDLIKEKKILFGKGVNGTYYSPYFRLTKQDNSTRNTVEVGALAVLLKTGLIGLCLFLSLLIASIYYSFFHSNNIFTVGIGFMNLVYLFLFFVENLFSYSIFNILVWFFIGVGLSNKVRKFNDSDILKLLNN